MEGADISVCVRIRPLLDYEHRAGFFGMVFASNPKVQFYSTHRIQLHHWEYLNVIEMNTVSCLLCHCTNYRVTVTIQVVP